jgi:hypothetical protein
MQKIIWIVVFVGLSVGSIYTWSNQRSDTSSNRTPVLQDGAPRFDFTSEITRAESMKLVKASLSKDDRKRLQQAILRLISAKIKEERTLSETQTLNQLEINKFAGDQIHGLTAAEVIAKASKVKPNLAYRNDAAANL